MIVGLKVKHGVPAVAACGPSGSFVGRCITTALPWPAVNAKVARSAAAKAQAKHAAVERTVAKCNAVEHKKRAHQE